MDLYSPRTDIQFAGDLLGREASHKQGQHLLLAPSQYSGPFLNRPPPTALCCCYRNCFQKSFLVDWLLKIIGGVKFPHGFYCSTCRRPARYKDDADTVIDGVQLLGKSEAVDFTHHYI